MLTLAIDTAADACAACVHDSVSGRVVGRASEIIGRGHAERLMALVDAALAAAGLDLSAIDRIAVTVGPGSFTGIRVGVSVARALALALGRDAVGVSTLEALGVAAASRTDVPVLAVIDARRGEVYAQLFDADGRPCEGPAALGPADAADLARRAGAILAGSGAAVVGAADAACLEHAQGEGVDIAVVAAIAARRQEPFDRPRPLYLRGADAKPQTGFAIPRKAASGR